MYKEFIAFYRQLSNLEKSFVYAQIDTSRAERLRFELESILQEFADKKFTELFLHISNLHTILNNEKKDIFFSHLTLLASSDEGKTFVSQVLLPFANCDIKNHANVYQHSKKFSDLLKEMRQKYKEIYSTSIDERSITSQMIIAFLHEQTKPQEKEVEARKSSGGVPNFSQISGIPGSKDGHWYSLSMPLSAGIVAVELFCSDNLEQICQYKENIRRDVEAFREEQIQRIERGELANKRFHIYQASMTTREELIPEENIVERIDCTFSYYLGHLIKTTGIKTEQEARELLKFIYTNNSKIKNDPSPKNELRLVAANAMNHAIDRYVNLYKKLTPTPKTIVAPTPSFSFSR